MTQTATVTKNTFDVRAEQPKSAFCLGTGRLMSRSKDNQLSEKITDLITKELINAFGPEYVLELNKDRNGRKVDLVLTGAIGKLGKEMIISTKIVDVKNSQVLFAKNSAVQNEKDIPEKAKELSIIIAEFLNTKYNK
jgi:hypothetical protein